MFINLFLPLTAGLAIAQVLVYRISIKQAAGLFWIIAPWYFLLFFVVESARACVAFLDIIFYELPFVSLALYLAARVGALIFPKVKSAFREVPDFYLLSSLWIGFVWVVFSSGYQENEQLGIYHQWLVTILTSIFLALLLPVLAGIKERVKFTTPSLLPLFLLSVSFILGALIILLP